MKRKNHTECELLDDAFEDELDNTFEDFGGDWNQDRTADFIQVDHHEIWQLGVCHEMKIGAAKAEYQPGPEHHKIRTSAH